MLDIYFRSIKDRVFEPTCNFVPRFITPLHITATAFAVGLASCFFASHDDPTMATGLWLLNRALDCLDGALARHRNQASDLGGFLDLLCDFIVYSLIPIACASSCAGDNSQIHNLWLAVAFVEASFHINNFVLFYAAVVLEKRKAEDVKGKAEDGARHSGTAQRGVQELTSVMMRPALIEGMESGVLFTVMLMKPEWTEILCWTMAVLVGFGIGQRVSWLVSVM